MNLCRKIHSFLYILALSLAMVLAAACSSNQQPGEEPVIPEVYRAGFFLSVGEVSDITPSRAPSDGIYDPGQGLENFIDLTDPNNVRVALFDMDDSFMGEITDFTVTPLESYDSSKRYYLNGSTTADISSGRFKVLVLANWPQYPAVLSLDNVWKGEFSFVGPVPTRENPIPLFGIKAVSLPGVEPGFAADLGTLHLLRAVAKIEVVLDDPSGFWHFSKLYLSHYNSTGLCAPTGITSQDSYVTGSWASDYVGFTSVPESAQVLDKLDFIDAGDNHYVLYVPEYNNSRLGTPEAEIVLDFDESILGERRIVVRDNNGTRLDFRRNVWYRVTVKKQAEDSELEFSVDVIPYAVVPLDPIFGID